MFLGLLAFSGMALAGSAQVKASVTTKIKTPTIGCEDCKNRIEAYLNRYDGVTYVMVNWRQKNVTVKYLTDRTNIEEIKTAISNCGYDAGSIHTGAMTTDSFRFPKSPAHHPIEPRAFLIILSQNYSCLILL